MKLKEVSQGAMTDAASEVGSGPLPAVLAGSRAPLRQQVFELVRGAGTISRAQIARDIAVSPASITSATTELIGMGLLEEVAAPRSDLDPGRGRPPVSLGVRKGTHHVAGIKVSDNKCTAVIHDLAGHQVAHHVQDIAPRIMSADTLLGIVESSLDAVLKLAGFQRHDLSALGLGLPGFVNHAEGHVHWSPLLVERNLPLARIATARLGLELVIDNDANLVTLAELWFGAGRRIPNFAVVTIEHGLGMGVVVDHVLYRGAKGVGLELGHSKVQLDGALCRCGQRGCLEAYVADYALAREARTALDWIADRNTTINDLLEALFDAAKAGKPTARSIFYRAGRYLAVGLANVINLFDPALIVLSGERMKFDYLYASETMSELDNLVINTGRPLPRIEVNAWGDLVWAKGAAALAMGTLTESLLGHRLETAAE